MTTPAWLIRFLRDGRAAAAIEFAMLAPVMLTIIVGVFEYSRVLTAQHMVRDIVDEAARNGVVREQTDDEVKVALKAKMDDVPGLGTYSLDVTSTASSLSVSVTATMNLIAAERLPTPSINFTTRIEYPK